MIIRNATLKGRKAVLGLIRELQAFLDLKPGEIRTFDRLYASLLKEKNHLLLVAEEKGDILGLARLWFRKSLFHSGTCCFLDELIVRKDVPGEGRGPGPGRGGRACRKKAQSRGGRGHDL